MEKREVGQKKYTELVYNKMKPKWLFAQVASHPLANYWFLWIDEGITKDVFKSNIQTLNSAGFDLLPFQNWEQS